ncbi:MAG: META domain-containing protein [Alphaproteobacteria bacterium]|nr:META domain-containing protein [Alphaproteobacteria bacterium]
MRRFLTILAVGLTLSACESAVSNDQGEGRLAQNDWIAETIAGRPVINPARVTLAFLEGRVSGRSGCNLYSGPVEIGPGTLKIGALISTKMACMQEGVMQQESAYLSALQSAQTYSIGGDKLTITTPTGSIVYGATARQAQPGE